MVVEGLCRRQHAAVGHAAPRAMGTDEDGNRTTRAGSRLVHGGRRFRADRHLPLDRAHVVYASGHIRRTVTTSEPMSAWRAGTGADACDATVPAMRATRTAAA